MIIPASFREAIKNTFYDKTVTRFTTTNTVDSDGWARKSATTIVAGTFLGNVHFDNFDKIQEEYGITDQINIVITTDTEIATEEIIGYDGKQYKVFRVIPNDSHYLLIAQDWLSKSSTSISA